jgi:hypothetical protein
MEQLLEKIQQSTNHRQEVTEAATKVTIELMEQHLVQPTKVHTMIQAFMATLVKDMRTLNENTTSHEVALEELSYRRVISLYDQFEVWTTYIRDKGT